MNIERNCYSIREHTKKLAEFGVALKRTGNAPGGMEVSEHAKLIDRLVHAIEAQDNTPETLWNRFIEHLNATQPLRSGTEHKTFLGSVESYRKIFMEAQNELSSEDTGE